MPHLKAGCQKLLDHVDTLNKAERLRQLSLTPQQRMAEFIARHTPNKVDRSNEPLVWHTQRLTDSQEQKEKIKINHNFE